MKNTNVRLYQEYNVIIKSTTLASPLSIQQELYQDTKLDFNYIEAIILHPPPPLSCLY
jgi:hypothetical protein